MISWMSFGLAAAGFFAGYPALNDGRGTADTGVDFQGLDRTVEGAGAAFHAAVAVGEADFVAGHFKNLMRADVNTLTAADAAIRI